MVFPDADIGKKASPCDVKVPVAVLDTCLQTAHLPQTHFYLCGRPGDPFEEERKKGV